jgi:predicted DNA binding CopG/RHH family protein
LLLTLFWQKADSTDFIDWSKAKKAQFPNLKPSTKSISLRVPESLLNEIKIAANKKDIPYQSLMKLSGVILALCSYRRLTRSLVTPV